MIHDNQKDCLLKPIKDLPFTEDFRSFSQKLGVKTIGEMINIPVAELIKSEGFTYHALQELIKFLKENHIGYLLKQ